MTSSDLNIISSWQKLITYHNNDINSLHKVGFLLSGFGINPNNHPVQHESSKIILEALHNKTQRMKNLTIFILLIPFALAGILLNGIFYFPLRTWIKKITEGSIFLDSVSFGIMSFLFPVFSILESILFNYLFGIHFVFWLIAIPLSAWLLLECRYQFYKFASLKN
ncbi:MAG: hypothetical protein C5B52_03350 [Bacteroidetes bacterium]|nr:MAG: hypothetical protein C5B52_03350 [Bacteroidota bacterium]